LANSKQAKKRARQSENRRQHNASRRSEMRTYIKKVRRAVAVGDKAAAAEAFKLAEPFIDRLSGQGIIHENTAARYKKRLSAAVKLINKAA
jgi:small subunit ribosomal protein S20